MEKNDNMNIKIQKASVNGLNNNKGSSKTLVNYINHEDKDRLEAGLEPLPFTAPNGEDVSTDEVIAAIDANTKGLSRNADKFYHLVVSPSIEEIKAMGSTDNEVYESGLKLIKYISDAYASNFRRNGLDDSGGLEIYWKPHFTRGNTGELQFHIHGVVSRQTKALPGLDGKRLKISPLTNHKDTTKGAVKGGFDRIMFIRSCEKLFDKLFEYNRKVAESFDYQNAMKHGTADEKAGQAERLVAENAETLKESISAGITRRRKHLSEKRAIEEIAAIIEDGVSLPHPKMDAVMPAIHIAEMKNSILRHFSSETSIIILELHLVEEGITYSVVQSKEGGVDDIIFYKAGQRHNAKDIMTPQDYRMLLVHWQRLSGQIPSFRLQEQRAEEERQKEISQHRMGGPRMHR